MSSKNIYQRINAVMKDVEYVQKDAEIQGYKAVTHDMVTAVLRKALVANGIVVEVRQKKGKYLQMRGENGNKMHLYAGRYQVEFVNMDNPQERLCTVVEGHANDNGDKAPGKAASYAVKYAMLKTFTLETGENDEQRFADPYTPEQHEIYHDLIETDKAYEFYLFVATLPPETVTGLVNSFPDGKKSQGKKKAGAMEKQGQELFASTVEQVQGMLANHDPAVLEITDEMTPIEKKFLAKRLSEFEVKQLQKLKTEAA